MASSTKQLTINRGQDGASSRREQRTTSNNSRTARPQTSSQVQRESPVTTTQVTRPASRESVESTDAQTVTTTEDHAFTLQFSVPLDGAVPCEVPTL